MWFLRLQCNKPRVGDAVTKLLIGTVMLISASMFAADHMRRQHAVSRKQAWKGKIITTRWVIGPKMVMGRKLC